MARASSAKCVSHLSTSGYSLNPPLLRSRSHPSIAARRSGGAPKLSQRVQTNSVTFRPLENASSDNMTSDVDI